MDDVKTGTIIGFRGSYMSGLGHLIVDDEEDGQVFIPCQNGPTVRALEAAFGDAIGPGHTVNQEGIKGKRIRYSVDEIGVLDGFTPEEE